jgi:hypothetical protein
MTDFDQDLYDRVMAKYSPVSVREGHELYEEGRRAGYHQATLEAAHISAERQPVPVIPDWVEKFIIVMLGERWTSPDDGHDEWMKSSEGWGDTPNDALTSAIEAAKESDHEH